MIKGGALGPAEQGKDIFERAAAMEDRYRSHIKAQRDRLETMQHRLLELLGVVAECRQTIDEDWQESESPLGEDEFEDLLQRVYVMLGTGVATDRRNVAGVENGDEEHHKMLAHVMEEHGVSQVFADLTPVQLVELHNAMHGAERHQHKMKQKGWV